MIPLGFRKRVPHFFPVMTGAAQDATSWFHHFLRPVLSRRRYSTRRPRQHPASCHRPHDSPPRHIGM